MDDNADIRIDYDRKSDAAYVYLKPVADGIAAAKTVPLDPREIDGEINLDFDREGRLVGLEVLEASRFLSPAMLKLASDV